MAEKGWGKKSTGGFRWFVHSGMAAIGVFSMRELLLKRDRT